MPDPLPVSPTRDVRKLLEPKPRYRRVVDRLECPVCGKQLGEMRSDYGREPTLIAYTDTWQKAPPSRLVVRRFHPCGCEHIALVDPSPAASREDR